MSKIKDLSRTSTVSTSDQLVVTSNDGTLQYRVPVQQLTEYMQTALDLTAVDPVVTVNTQTGGGLDELTVSATTDILVVYTPVSPSTTLTLLLPTAAQRFDMQTVTLCTDQSSATLAIDGNGASISGTPTTFSTTLPVTVRYHLATNTWYRIE